MEILDEMDTQDVMDTPADREIMLMENVVHLVQKEHEEKMELMELTEKTVLQDQKEELE